MSAAAIGDAGVFRDTPGGDGDAVVAGVDDGIDDDDFEPVVVTTRNVTASELAAVSAVVRGLLAEEGDARRAAEPRGPSAWQRSQRSLRGAIEPGPGRWNG